MRNPLLGVFGSLILLLGLTGCEKMSREQQAFEPNYLYAHAISVSQEVNTDQPLADSDQLLNLWFGTLDEPKVPELIEEEFPDLLSLENLQMAAGPPPGTTEPGDRGLYRQQCASCHGESGQGRGPVAASQNPYPREFRNGWFKYRSTERQSKPLKEDLSRILRHGLGDSQMPKFTKLSDPQINALVDYVIYLSIRGELERKLLNAAAFDLDLDAGDRVYDPSNAEKAKEQLETASELLNEVAGAWDRATRKVEVFDPPKDFPIIGSETAENRDRLAESIEKGRKLFLGEVAACSKCHGESAKGEGNQAPDYDDWIKEWTKKIGIEPTNNEELLPFLARGGLKPQALKPRNIVAGHLRGGREPLDIYRRIRYGIPGATMPAAAMAAAPGGPGLTNDDIWHLVNYVLSIAQIPTPPQTSNQ